MSNYQRLISYIYTYEGGIKGKNIGFAKLETRGNQCRITVNVKKIFVGGNPIGIYLLAGEDEIKIGTLFARNGAGEFRALVNAQNVEGSGHSLEECFGLSVHDTESAWRSYTTIWEDAVAHAAEVELADVTAEKVAGKEKAVQAEDGAAQPLPISKEIEEELEREELSTLSSEIPKKGGGEESRQAPLREAEIHFDTVKELQPGEEEPADQNVMEESADSGVPGEYAEADTVGKYADAGIPGEYTEAGVEGESMEPAAMEEYTETGVPGRYMEAGAPGEYLEAGIEGESMEPAAMAGYTETGMPGGYAEAGMSGGYAEAGMPGGYAEAGMPEGYAEAGMPGESAEAGVMGESARPGVMRESMEAGSIREYANSGTVRNYSGAVMTGNFPETGRTERTMEAGMIRESMKAEPSGEPAKSGVMEASVEAGAEQRTPDRAMEDFPAQGAAETPDSRFAQSRQGASGMPQMNQSYRRMNPPRSVGSGMLRKETLNTEAVRPGPVSRQEAGAGTIPPPGLQDGFKDLSDACSEQEMWDLLRKRYPKIQAFDYADGCEILSIKPQDIGLLPREAWVFGNNSFLLHGYYSYRYLILARLNNPSGRPRFLLGVPGHYFSNEKYMASMFGFPDFVLAKKQPPRDGRFGYWYTDVKIGN